jgi:hexosaminidase
MLQGWRLEIKAYPRLTEFGSWRGKDESQRYGGFYTQAEVCRDLLLVHLFCAFCTGISAAEKLRQMTSPFVVWGQVKEVVAYAARRFITVVPEIELPGHCGAALACYPYLSCTACSHAMPLFILIE